MNPRYLPKRGTRVDVLDHKLCDKIREKLKVTKEQLPNKMIKSITDISNKEIGKWIVNNPDGFILKDMGILCASKHLPKELRENKEETIEKVLMLDISDHFRKKVLSRYNVEIDRRIDFGQLVNYQKLIPHLNIHSFFYTFRIMWFNHRNCKTKKGSVYGFDASREIKKQLYDKVIEGKEYYEWTFTDFYKRKMHTKWE